MAWSPPDLPVQGEFAFLAPWGIPVAGRQKGEEKAAVSRHGLGRHSPIIFKDPSLKQIVLFVEMGSCKYLESGAVTHAFNPSTMKVGAGRSL